MALQATLLQLRLAEARITEMQSDAERAAAAREADAQAAADKRGELEVRSCFRVADHSSPAWAQIIDCSIPCYSQEIIVSLRGRVAKAEEAHSQSVKTIASMQRSLTV